MAEETKVWSKDVIAVTPKDQLTLVAGSSVMVEIVNNGAIKVTYKLKATRPKSIHPDSTHGSLGPNGGKVSVKVSFKPMPDEGPFTAKDHFTVLVSPLVGEQTPEEYWKSEEAKLAQRITVPLKQ